MKGFTLSKETIAAAPLGLKAKFAMRRSQSIASKRVSWSRLLVPAILSGILLWLCHFPVAWGWLAWIALVPLLSLVRSGARPRAIYWSAWLGGLAFFLPVLQWTRVAHPYMHMAWVALAIYCALYVPLAIFFVRRLDRNTRFPLVLTVPLVWTGLEYFRSFFGTGFAWYFLGHSQHDFLEVIQISDLGGAYLVTVLVAMVNAFVFELLYAGRWFRELLTPPKDASSPPLGSKPRWLIVQGLVIALLIIASLGYGSWRLDQERDFKAGPIVALLQTNVEKEKFNVDPSATDADADKARREIVQQCGLLVHCARNLMTKPDLNIWPETSFPQDWLDVAPTADLHRVPAWWSEGQNRSRAVYRTLIVVASGTNNLVGCTARVIEDSTKSKPEKYNSALLLRADGKVAGRYDKIHPLPFGEYVPLRDWLPFLQHFTPWDGDWGIRAGEKLTRLPLGKYHFGVIICYEAADPVLARQYSGATEDGPAVDFLANISNDGWFDGTSEHEEHLAVCRFRAIESRRAIARSVNMGISAMIDGNGRVHAPMLVDKHEGIQIWAANANSDGRVPSLPVSEWSRFKQVAGVLTAVVPLDTRTSVYAVWGDWLPQTCWAGIALGLVWAVWTRRRVRAGSVS
jgi:apolipoprotein N-acyltransferase